MSSILYKPDENVRYNVSIQKLLQNDKINFEFSCNGGKFGTHEQLAEYEVSVKKLLTIFNEHESIVNKLENLIIEIDKLITDCIASASYYFSRKKETLGLRMLSKIEAYNDIKKIIEQKKEE